MLVLKLSQMGPCVLAACSNGHLYLWKLADTLQTEKSHKLLSQTTGIFLNEVIKSMECIQTKAIVFSKYAAYIVEVDLNSFELSQQTVHPIFRNVGEEITKTVLLNTNEVLLGSNRGNVYRYGFLSKISSRVNKVQNDRQTHHNFDFFVSYSSFQPQTTALAYDQNIAQNYVFVGYSNGMIIKYNLATCQQNDSYFQSFSVESTQREPVVELKIKTRDNQLYSLHQRFILIWDIYRKDVVQVIEIYRPVNIVFLRDNTHAIISQSHKLYFINTGRNNLLMTVGHTSRLGVSSAIYSYNGREYLIVGGICGLVDIFQQTVHLATCFVSTQKT